MMKRGEEQHRINVRIDDEARRELDFIQSTLGIRTDSAAILFSIRHIKKHIEAGDFGEIYLPPK